MDKGAFEFSIHPDRRAAFAVYAVAMGEHLGLDIETLKLIRRCAENSKLSRQENVARVLLFLEVLYQNNLLGEFPVSESILNLAKNGDRSAAAYCAVVPLIQPLHTTVEKA